MLQIKDTIEFKKSIRILKHRNQTYQTIWFLTLMRSAKSALLFGGDSDFSRVYQATKWVSCVMYIYEIKHHRIGTRAE